MGDIAQVLKANQRDGVTRVGDYTGEHLAEVLTLLQGHLTGLRRYSHSQAQHWLDAYRALPHEIQARKELAGLRRLVKENTRMGAGVTLLRRKA